jgi:hypothetical protein
MVTKRALGIIFGLLMTVGLPLSASASSFPGTPPDVVRLTSSSGDWRCFYGPGIQVWEDVNKGGRTMILCGTRAYWSNLTNKREQLGLSNWNDRVSSFETFNTSVGITNAFRLCTDANNAGTCWLVVGSTYVANVGSTYNDRISSIKGSVVV